MQAGPQHLLLGSQSSEAQQQESSTRGPRRKSSASRPTTRLPLQGGPVVGEQNEPAHSTYKQAPTLGRPSNRRAALEALGGKVVLAGPLHLLPGSHSVEAQQQQSNASRPPAPTSRPPGEQRERPEKDKQHEPANSTYYRAPTTGRPGSSRTVRASSQHILPGSHSGEA